MELNLKKNGKLNTNYKDIKKYLEKNNLEKEKITLSDLRKIIIYIRKNKLPDWKKIGTAGSFFKCPIVDEKIFQKLKKLFPQMPYYRKDIGCKTSICGKYKIPLAYILDEPLGWKGRQKGNVGVFEKHSLIVVNYRKGTAQEIKNFATEISKDVKQKTGLEISFEIVIW